MVSPLSFCFSSRLTCDVRFGGEELHVPAATIVGQRRVVPTTPFSHPGWSAVGHVHETVRQDRVVMPEGSVNGISQLAD